METPILAASTVSEDAPRRALMILVRPEPMVCPMDSAFPANHEENGSAISLSHAMCILPNKSAFAQSAPDVNSPIVRRTSAIFASTLSNARFTASPSAGICAVIHSMNSRRYGLIRSPPISFTLSAALCRSVMEPDRLSSMVSCISFAAPSAPCIALVSLYTSAGAAFIIASQPDIAYCPAMVFA